MVEAQLMDINQQVEDALEQIRPFLHEDGGDISLLEITDDLTVKVKFEGACTSCSMSNMTFTAGVKESILKAVPQVKEVIAVNL